MRRISVIIALAIAAGACGSDSSTEPQPDPTPDPLSITDWQVVAVSGDQEVPAASTSMPGVILASASVGPDGYSVERLIARIELTPEAKARGMSLDGLPANTLVHWHIDDGGGTLFGQTTAPDDTAYIINRWKPSTLADDYIISAGRLVDGAIVIDATWTVTVEPGPAAQIDAPESYSLWLGDTLDLTGLASVADAYGNPLPAPEWEGVESTLLYASAVEGYDTLTVFSGEVSRDMVVATIQRIGPGWTYSLICRDVTEAAFYYNEPMDSLRSIFTIDSVAPSADIYAKGEGFIKAFWTGKTLMWHPSYGPGTRQHDNGWDITSGDEYTIELRPGEARVWWSGPLIAADNPPTSYIGEGKFCGKATEIIETFTAPD